MSDCRPGERGSERAIHIPPELLREYLGEAEGLVAGMAHPASDCDAVRLTWSLAQGVTARLAKDPRFVRCLRQQMSAVVPEDELLEGLRSGSLDGLLAKYFPGGFSD
jgi:hypothetical protein